MRAPVDPLSGCWSLVNYTRSTRLSPAPAFAATRRARRRGLAGRECMEEGESLVLPRCRQVHTFGMRFDIDVLFLDRGWKVLAAIHRMEPGRLSPLILRSRVVVELPWGTLESTGTVAGDQVLLQRA